MCCLLPFTAWVYPWNYPQCSGGGDGDGASGVGGGGASDSSLMVPALTLALHTPPVPRATDFLSAHFDASWACCHNCHRELMEWNKMFSSVPSAD